RSRSRRSSCWWRRSARWYSHAAGAAWSPRRRSRSESRRAPPIPVRRPRPPGYAPPAATSRGGSTPSRWPRLQPTRPARRAVGDSVAIGWYLTVSALIFAIGAGGVLVRRNPLVILLCLELMLNGANLALVAFARMWGSEDGQIFALIVMVVAACE